MTEEERRQELERLERDRMKAHQDMVRARQIKENFRRRRALQEHEKYRRRSRALAASGQQSQQQQSQLQNGLVDLALPDMAEDFSIPAPLLSTRSLTLEPLDDDFSRSFLLAAENASSVPKLSPTAAAGAGVGLGVHGSEESLLADVSELFDTAFHPLPHLVPLHSSPFYLYFCSHGKDKLLPGSCSC